MFEDNVGEDGLSAQSSYIINISDSNYIENLAPNPDMFDNEIVLEMILYKKAITSWLRHWMKFELKKTGSTLSILCNGKSHNTCIGQVKV